MRPRDGEVLALAGIAYSAPQPPGSVFKIVTLAGALEAGVAKPLEQVPGPDRRGARGRRARERQRRVLRRHAARQRSRTRATRSSPRWAPSSAPSELVGDGRALRLQRRPGAGRRDALHDPGGRRDRRRPRGRLDRDRPGQGARHAAAVRGSPARSASDGVRARPTLRKGAPPRAGRRAAPASRARRHTCARSSRPGPASPPRSPASRSRARPAPPSCATPPTTTRPDDPNAPPPDDTTDTNAWFAAYAPMRRPKLAVAVMLIGQGAGGDTAAPVRAPGDRGRA